MKRVNGCLILVCSIFRFALAIARAEVGCDQEQRKHTCECADRLKDCNMSKERICAILTNGLVPYLFVADSDVLIGSAKPWLNIGWVGKKECAAADPQPLASNLLHEAVHFAGNWNDNIEDKCSAGRIEVRCERGQE